MKTHKRFTIVFTAVMMLSLVLVGGAAAKPGNKVEICHNTGNGSFALVKVKADTLQTHLAHGDAAPGQAVPGQAGMVFAADCSVTSTVQNPQVQPPRGRSTNNNGKKADKVFVCHKRGNGTFILINISRNALPAHLLHGDGLQNGGVPSQPGMKFTATCSIAEQKELVQTILVESNHATDNVFVPYPSDSLLNGQLYELRVSGTYTFDDFLHQADAEYSNPSGPWIKGDTGYSHPNLLDLSINDCTTNRDWGEFKVDHVYTMNWTGTGAPLSFCILDDYYGDNVGALKVEIFKVNP